MSLAVALSSRPIHSLGRIWADGNLLRGTAGDLKTAGQIRFYQGYRDQLPDPLIAAAEGAQASAFRGLAYVVFENLSLGDFGNRIPALTFEIVAEEFGPISLVDIAPGTSSAGISGQLPGLLGFTDEGGPLTGTLGVIDQLFDLSSVAGGKGLELSRLARPTGPVADLPEEIVASEGEGAAARRGRERTRAAHSGARPVALRYYDQARDYQIGIQRAFGDLKESHEQTIEFPGALDAQDARALTLAMAQEARWTQDRLSYRIAELDPELVPGGIVRLASQPGLWAISGWEWLDRGVELALERIAPVSQSPLQGDPGTLLPPPDLALTASRLWVFELPMDGLGQNISGSYFAALSADGPGWPGASLYLDQNGSLLPLAETSRIRSVAGSLVTPLAASNAIFLEPASSIEVELIASDLTLPSSTPVGLAAGANRLLVGQEVLQFTDAEQLTETRWKLSGLLRGRGGTEQFAAIGEPVGSHVVLLDDSLRLLDPGVIAGSTATIVAIGLGDEQPAQDTLQPSGMSRNPPSPVHTRRSVLANEDWHLCWARRARGEWRWLDLVDTPLVEQEEFYEIGLGPVDTPITLWTSTKPELTIAANTIQGLAAAHGPAPLWVRQVGTFGKSPAAYVANLQ